MATTVEIESSIHCNASCIHCPRGAIGRPMGTMSWEVFEIVADKILDYPEVMAVDFAGMGEPTLNPLLPRFIAHFSGKVPTFITTNASLLTPDKIAELIDAGLNNFIVSFNGHNAETYELMMERLSFTQVNERVQSLLDLGAGKVRVLANVSVTRQTQPHLPAIRAYLTDLGIQEISFSQCHSRGGHLKSASICDTPMPPLGDSRCDIFKHTLFVAWDGYVLACCHDLGGEARIGNLVIEDLEVILERKRRTVQKGVRFPMCKDCNDLYRFAQDPTPDETPLSEWVYALYASEDARITKLIDTIKQREARIQELEQTVTAYESGRFISFMKKLKGILRR